MLVRRTPGESIVSQASVRLTWADLFTDARALDMDRVVAQWPNTLVGTLRPIGARRRRGTLRRMTKVAQDSEAFTHIYGRLTGDVGGILKLVNERRMHVPFWSLVRLLFPVAESIADLIYHQASPSTAANLTSFLQNELGNVRSAYQPVAATLTLLYRHSLTHQDELRIIRSGGKEVLWHIDVAGPHLAISKDGKKVAVEFNPMTFYDDLTAGLKVVERKSWNGIVRDRYNEWQDLDLDARLAKKATTTEKTAAVEIAAL